MNRRFHTFFAVALACGVSALAGPAQASAACPNADLIPTAENLDLVRQAVTCLTNEARANAGAELLSADARLVSAADSHANDMVARRFFGHDAPSGLDTFGRLRSTGYIRRGVVWNAGETIAWGTGAAATPRSVVDAWLDATTQRLTLLAPDFRDIGVGVALGAPVELAPGAAPAVTYTVDYGWRKTQRALRRCLRRAARKNATLRQAMRAKCHGLGRVAAKVG